MEIELVELRGGLVVPAPALALAWGLEARGWAFALKGDRLTVQRAETPPGGPQAVQDDLSEEDRAAIRRWRAHLVAIVAYQGPPAARPRIDPTGTHVAKSSSRKELVNQ